MAKDAPVWVLLGHRTGDNNQLLRVAEELGLPFRTIRLGYNTFRDVPVRLVGSSLASLDARSRAEIRPPWPKLVLGIGNRSVPAALAIRRLSGGKAKLVRLGNPRISPARFDLVITTLQYSVPDAPNVLRLPAGISTAAPTQPTSEEEEWLSALPRPHRLLLVGGDTFMWALSPAKVARAARELVGKPGSVIAITSGRTGANVREGLGQALRESERARIADNFPRYAVLVHDADEIIVTADSVAMISDAVAAGKPVGLLKPQMTIAGRIFYGAAKAGIGVPVRDIRRFWRSVRSLRLAGSISNPQRGKLPLGPLETAIAAIRKLLDD